MKIKAIQAREIIDSRGAPTVEADVILENGVCGRASVPGGASVGTMEALELRDGDQTRYHGRGVLNVIHNINTIIAPKVIGQDVCQQQNLDQMMIDLDATKNKAKLGANGILAVSLAITKAAAQYKQMPLFQYISELMGRDYRHQMPSPQMNIINGGAHADNGLVFQECMIVPYKMPTIADAVRAGVEIFYALKHRLQQSGYATNVGDEGGFAPDITNLEQAFEYIMRAIEDVGYKAGKDIYCSIDAAASEFYRDGKYHAGGYKPIDYQQLTEYYQKLCKQYPIISLEDPLDENHWEAWSYLTKKLGKDIVLVGDDLFVTNSEILQKGIDNQVANAILVKMNQVGTVSETLQTIQKAQDNNYKTIISHRSGETEDVSIAHLAIACDADFIKTGSLYRTDRTAKYNELIRIAELLK